MLPRFVCASVVSVLSVFAGCGSDSAVDPGGDPGLRDIEVQVEGIVTDLSGVPMSGSKDSIRVRAFSGGPECDGSGNGFGSAEPDLGGRYSLRHAVLEIMASGDSERCVWISVSQNRTFGNDFVGRSEVFGGVVARLYPSHSGRLDTIRIDAAFERMLAPWVAVLLTRPDATEIADIDFSSSGTAIWHEDGTPIYWAGAERHTLPLDRADLLGPDGAVYGRRGGTVARWLDGVVEKLGDGNALRGVTIDGRVYYDDRVWFDGMVTVSDLPPGDIVTPDGRVLAGEGDECRIYEDGSWSSFVLDDPNSMCVPVAGADGGWALFRDPVHAVVRSPQEWRHDRFLRAPTDVNASGMVVSSRGFWSPDEEEIVRWENLIEPHQWEFVSREHSMATNNRSAVLVVAEEQETSARAMIILRPR